MATISLLDPTTLLGREIAEHVAVAFPGAACRYFHTSGVDEHLILELAEAPALVPPLASCDELDGSAVVVVPESVPEATALDLLSWLHRHPETALVDASQPGLAGDVATTVLSGAPPGAAPRWYHVADPGLFGPARLVRAVGPLRPEALHAVLLRPASDNGEEGVQELVAQAAARLSGASPAPPRRLSTVLAFDLAPAGDAVHGALSGQLAALLPGVRATLQGVDAGIFHGHVAVAMVTLKEPATLTALRTLIRKAPGLHLARAGQSLRPSDVPGRDDVLCGELRIDGTEVTAWLVADGLRVAGARAVGDILADLGVLSG